MIDKLIFQIGNCTQNDAQVTIKPLNDSEVVEVSGFVRGPFCEFTRTLTADFALQPVGLGGVESKSVAALIMEPCYWTPQLPFMYELHLKLKMADGREENSLFRTGMKRWHRVGRNLKLEQKRIVLRGLRCNSLDEKSLQLARQCEAAILVPRPDAHVCALASRLGVPLIADLRAVSQLQDVCRKLDWYPSVLIVLLSPEQLAGVATESRLPKHCLSAASLSVDNTSEDSSGIGSDGFAVELPLGGRPLPWLAEIDKPVIAISTGPGSEIPDARAGSDCLQAALAPHFDLAGYIV